MDLKPPVAPNIPTVTISQSVIQRPEAYLTVFPYMLSHSMIKIGIVITFGKERTHDNIITKEQSICRSYTQRQKHQSQSLVIYETRKDPNNKLKERKSKGCKSKFKSVIFANIQDKEPNTFPKKEKKDLFPIHAFNKIFLPLYVVHIQRMVLEITSLLPLPVLQQISLNPRNTPM